MKKNRKIKNAVKIYFLMLIMVVISIGMYYYINTNKLFEKKIILPLTPEKEPNIEKNTISLVMVGDALIHGAVYADAKTSNGYDFKPIFTEIKNTIASYDLAFYNQETILGGSEMGLSTYPQFNSPYEVGDAFIDMGFNLVSLATNHTLDRGWTAIKNSRNYWDRKTDVIAAGSYISQEQKDAVVVKKIKGIKYGLLSYTTLTNGLIRPTDKPYSVNIYDEKLVKEDIKKLRDEVDVLMVAMHWGIEYSHGISNEQKEIANYLSNLGVDIIIGHHPHVVEPIEFINNTLVIYSLGNFISAQNGIERLTGLMASVNINKTVVDGINIMYLSKPSAELVYTCKNTATCRNGYKVYPYSKLNNNILPGYKNYYDRYINIVKSIDNNIDKIEIK